MRPLVVTFESMIVSAVSRTMLTTSLTLRNRPPNVLAASCMSATSPATRGAAMLVPLIVL